MAHLRCVAPSDRTGAVLELLGQSRSVCNVITPRGAAQRRDGDAILCDVAREDASVVIDGLKRLGIHEDGSIALEPIDTAISRAADEAERRAPGSPADAVVWEEVEERTRENVEPSAAFVAF